MEKQILVETISFKVNPKQITEGINKSGNLIVEGLLATAEKVNGNGRYYSREIWEREISRYNDEHVKNNNAVGELDHPDSSVVNLKNACHNIKKIWWDGDRIYGQLEILPTPSGNILKALIQSGITVGVSSRGMGSLKQIGETLEVQDDFTLLCWDFVSTPSNKGSWMEPVNLNEGLSLNSFNKYSKVNSIITDILCSNGTCPVW
jgi:hypothetical protein